MYAIFPVRIKSKKRKTKKKEPKEKKKNDRKLFPFNHQKKKRVYAILSAEVCSDAFAALHCDSPDTWNCTSAIGRTTVCVYLHCILSAAKYVIHGLKHQFKWDENERRKKNEAKKENILVCRFFGIGEAGKKRAKRALQQIGRKCCICQKILVRFTYEANFMNNNQKLKEKMCDTGIHKAHMDNSPWLFATWQNFRARDTRIMWCIVEAFISASHMCVWCAISSVSKKMLQTHMHAKLGTIARKLCRKFKTSNYWFEQQQQQQQKKRLSLLLRSKCRPHREKPICHAHFFSDSRNAAHVLVWVWLHCGNKRWKSLELWTIPMSSNKTQRKKKNNTARRQKIKTRKMRLFSCSQQERKQTMPYAWFCQIDWGQ